MKLSCFRSKQLFIEYTPRVMKLGSSCSPLLRKRLGAMKSYTTQEQPDTVATGKDKGTVQIVQLVAVVNIPQEIYTIGKVCTC